MPSLTFSDDLWPFLKTGLSPALGTPAVQGRIKTALAQLPILSGGGIECRLAGTGAPLDLAVRTTAKAGGFARLSAATTLLKDQPEAEEIKAAWQRLREFAQDHQTADSPLGRAVLEAWLEFDMEKAQLPAPNFFARLDDDYACPPILGASRHGRQELAASLFRDAAAKLGVEIQPSALETLRLVLRHRPGPASVKFLGFMLARGQGGLRLTLADMPVTALTAFLRDVGWPCDHRPLVALIYFIEQHVPALSLQLDIDSAGKVQPRLGLELAFRDMDAPEAAWQRLLSGLVNLALCAPDKAEAVQAWPALFRRSDAPKKWPKGFSERQSWLRRSINHIKLTFAPTPDMPFQPGDMAASLTHQIVSGITTAKAYLAYHHPEP